MTPLRPYDGCHGADDGPPARSGWRLEHDKNVGLRAQKPPIQGERTGVLTEPEAQGEAVTDGYVAAPVPSLATQLLAGAAGVGADHTALSCEGGGGEGSSPSPLRPLLGGEGKRKKKKLPKIWRRLLPHLVPVRSCSSPTRSSSSWRRGRSPWCWWLWLQAQLFDFVVAQRQIPVVVQGLDVFNGYGYLCVFLICSGFDFQAHCGGARFVAPLCWVCW